MQMVNSIPVEDLDNFGFIYENGQCITLSDPAVAGDLLKGDVGTSLTGVDDQGVVVGWSTAGDGFEYKNGIYTPIEDGTWLCQSNGRSATHGAARPDRSGH